MSTQSPGSGTLAVELHEMMSSGGGGRPPWYDLDGVERKTFMIGIGGGSASGKTSVSERVIRGINLPNVVLLTMDAYYKVLTPEQSASARRNEYSFDCPDAFDLKLLLEHLSALKMGRSIQVPTYDFKTHARTAKTTLVYGTSVVVFEGILALTCPEITSFFDLKIYIDTDDDIRLARRLVRDIESRGRDLSYTLDMYFRHAKPGHDAFVAPSAKEADVIIPRGADNIVAIDLMIGHVRSLLAQHGIGFRHALKALFIDKKIDLGVKEAAYRSNVRALLEASSSPNKRLHALMTVLRDRTSDFAAFVEAADAVAAAIVEEALFVARQSSSALRAKAPETCAVAVMQGGCVFESPLRRAIAATLPIGRLLIANDAASGDPHMHRCELPGAIVKRSTVLVADGAIATGATAMMAIKVLLEHGVSPANIILCAVVCAPEGLWAIANAFPAVRVVCAAIDEGLDVDFQVLPGIGRFGERYFGL